MTDLLHVMSRAGNVKAIVLAATVVSCAAPLTADAQVTAWMQEIESTVSSLGIVTKQVSVSAANSNTVKLQAQQALQSTMADAYTTQQVKKTIDDFGPNGQLIDGCYQVGMAGMVANTEGATAAHASSAMARLYTVGDNGAANAGGVSGLVGGTTQVTQFPYAASVGQRIQRHLTRYCTVSEAQMGYCTLNANGMQGADEDFSVHLQPGKTYGWDQTEASTDFIKTVAPVRTTPDSGPCTSTACEAAQQARIQQESMMSMARYSFIRFTEAHETQKTGDAEQAAPQ
jgi:hypothetical protein